MYRRPKPLWCLSSSSSWATAAGGHCSIAPLLHNKHHADHSLPAALFGGTALLQPLIEKMLLTSFQKLFSFPSGQKFPMPGKLCVASLRRGVQAPAAHKHPRAVKQP